MQKVGTCVLSIPAFRHIILKRTINIYARSSLQFALNEKVLVQSIPNWMDIISLNIMIYYLH